MEDEQLKKGDKVMIVEDDDYVDHVKKHYGKELEIDHVKVTNNGKTTIYKVKGISSYATRSCLIKI